MCASAERCLAVSDFILSFLFPLCGATNLWGREHKVVCKSFVSMAYTCDHVLELVIRCIYYGSKLHMAACSTLVSLLCMLSVIVCVLLGRQTQGSSYLIVT